MVALIITKFLKIKEAKLQEIISEQKSAARWESSILLVLRFFGITFPFFGILQHGRSTEDLFCGNNDSSHGFQRGQHRGIAKVVSE